MLPNANLISCNFSSSPSLLTKIQIVRVSLQSPPRAQKSKISFLKTLSPGISSVSSPFLLFGRQVCSQICKSSFNSVEKSEDPVLEEGSPVENEVGSGHGEDGRDWTTSILLFGFWAALMYYVFILAPNQTPARDMYFLEKLLNLRGEDGFRMNEVLVSLWYMMGLWSLVYSMLLLPSGRSSKSRIPVWPFLVASCFGGAYVLLPYFVLWRPPAPPVEEPELGKWPLNFLESKLTAGVLVAAGLGVITYAVLAGGHVWKEFYQYFRESKFIHITCIDFTLLSTFAPFWVYNDMTARKWSDKGSWILPLALIPFLGPALYLVLRPRLSGVAPSLDSAVTKGNLD